MVEKKKNLTAPGEESTLTPAQREEIVAKVADLKERGKGLVVEQAKVTHAVVTGGMIGDTSKGAQWATQGDYAYDLGISGGLLSGLKALGKAMSLGLAEEHPAWDAVYSQRQSLGKVAAKADRLSTITAEAKRKAKATRAVTPASTPADETPEEDETPEGIWTAVGVIREGIGDLSREDARTLVASLSTLLEEAKAQVKAAPAPEVKKTA
jgi:hypothetical protein